MSSPGKARAVSDRPLAVWLRLLAPHLAVLVFWCWRHDAWACILAYHAQILFWSRREWTRLAAGWDAQRFWIFCTPGVLAGPLVFFLLPHMAREPVGTWLGAHGVSGIAWLLLVPYYGIVHPLLEEMHWAPLRAEAQPAGVAHVFFASYHALVLRSLLHLPWVVLACVALGLASALWGRMTTAARGGLLLPALSHLLADSSLVAAAVLLAR
jgi:hypothetical protein